MWLLHFLPDSFLHFIVNAILIAGAVGCLLFFVVLNRFLRLIPAVAPYYKAGQIASVVLLVAGIYFAGGMAAEDQWRERVREMEARVAAAEEQSKVANAALDKKATEKIKVVRGREVIVKQYITKEVAKYDSQCVIPKEFIKAHNDAAEEVRK